MVYFLKNCENTYCIEVRLKFSYPISSFRKGSHNRNTIPLEGSIPQQQHLFLINGNVASVGRKKSRVYFLLAMMYMRAERKILPGLSFPDLCHKVYNFQCGSHIGLCLSPFIFFHFFRENNQMAQKYIYVVITTKNGCPLKFQQL